MTPEQIGFEAMIMATMFKRKGHTDQSEAFAEAMITMTNDAKDGAPLSNGEVFFAVSSLMACCMQKMDKDQRAIVAVACGNVAIELAVGMDASMASQPKTEGAPT